MRIKIGEKILREVFCGSSFEDVYVIVVLVVVGVGCGFVIVRVDGRKVGCFLWVLFR